MTEIIRYGQVRVDGGFMEKRPHGGWVSFDDHIAALEAMKATVLEQAAKIIDEMMLCGEGADILTPRGNSGNRIGLGYAAAIRALGSSASYPECCPICGGDCAAANPPVMSCPMKAVPSPALEAEKATVKPLEWWEPDHRNNYTHGAKTILGTYYVNIDGGRYSGWMETFVNDKIEQWEGPGRGSLYQAQSDSQADYEQRILSAIVASNS